MWLNVVLTKKEKGHKKSIEILKTEANSFFPLLTLVFCQLLTFSL